METTPYVPANHRLQEVIMGYGDSEYVFTTTFATRTLGYVDIGENSHMYKAMKKIVENISDDWEITEVIKSKLQITYSSIVDGPNGKYIRIGADRTQYSSIMSDATFRLLLTSLYHSITSYCKKREVIELIQTVNGGFDGLSIQQLKKLVEISPLALTAYLETLGK